MILHSIVNPEYIFPYEPENCNCEFSTNPFDYINGKINTNNKYLNEYIHSWRETDGNRKKR